MDVNKTGVVEIDKELTDHRKAMREFDVQIRSNRPLLSICTYEENRVLDAIKAVCRRNDHNWEMFVWDISQGLRTFTESVLPENAPALDQLSVLEWFRNNETTTTNNFQILILKDYYKFMGFDGNAGQLEHQVVRELRNQAQDDISKHKAIILMGTTLYLPSELEKLCAVIDWPLPERYHISERVKNILEYAKEHPQIKEKFKLTYDQSEINDIVSAFQGLTLTEIELLCTYMVLTTDSMESSIIAGKKRDIIRKSGLVDWIEIENDIDSVGGLYGLKNWLKKRKDAFTQDAKDFGLPENPKGVLLVGIQGAGKSLSAQAIGNYWNLPLLRLDMGKIFSGIVGSSEENIRSVIKVAESIAPCVLWIDEIDKGLSGVASSNKTDGGTASRVFGTVLTWMQEKKDPVYVVATANDVSQLPPELLRKGRFDEIFFVDLPDDKERIDILKIHLNKRNRDSSNYDLVQLAKQSEEFTGAEIEAAIIGAMYEAFYDDKRDVTTQDITNAFSNMVPLARTMKENIDHIREWAKTRARHASRIGNESGSVTKTIGKTKKNNNILKSIDISENEEL